MSSHKDFWVIGVGASAGGLEALSSFFKNLPEKPNAAFIVAQHLAPHAKSMMVDLLSRQTNLPVEAVQNKAELHPGHIYIVPPNFDVTTVEGELRLVQAGEETRPKPSVDLFFSSLARSHGKRAVGIILSGTGSDGSEGIRAIKESGGVTLVQDAETAKYDGMPKSAYETGLIDAVLPPEKMAAQLFNMLDGGLIENLKSEPYSDEENVDFQKILRYLKKEIGADFSQYKISTIQRRIEKRLATLNIGSLTEYFKFLKNNSEELLALSQNMLVSVTAFFRDPDAYESVSKCLDEMIFRKGMDEELRIWSAGCATGEEPYTLAIIVSELCEKNRKPLTTKIFATDLDHEALAYARTGLYTAEEVSGVPKDLLEKYFDKKDNNYEARKFLRDMIVFARQDLIQNPPFVKIDLVTCRNVLIYFENALQSRIFEIFHYALRPSGILFLGKSESAHNSYFEAVDKREKIFRRLNVLSTITNRPQARYQIPGQSFNVPVKKKPTESETISLKAPIQLLKMLNVSGVVVDEDGVIIHLMGDVSEYINFPKGQADFRITNLLPKGLAVEFNVLLKRCQKDLKVVRSRPFRLEKDKKMFSFSIMPMDKEQGVRDLYLVAFEPRRAASSDEHHDVITAPDASQRLIELEQELSATKENLQTLIEELEISNEELQSLNEELSSTNEELQASNEELETTNEELQSTNEELMTMNEEISIKSSELRQAYVNLDNIQSSIASPLIVLDADLRLVRYNSNSLQVFSFTPQDINHPITKASCQCEIPEFEDILKSTVKSGKTHEVVCHTPRQVFQLRIHPSRDEARKIVGVIMVFFDNTEFFHAKETVDISEKRIRSIIDHSPTLITLKDNLGKYLTVNKSFLEQHKLKEADVIGKTDREIFPEDVANEIRDNDLEVLLKRQSISRQERFTLNGEEQIFHVNRFPLFGKNERNPYAVGSVSLNISAEHRAQELLKLSEGRYRAMIENQAVFVVRHLPAGKITYTNSMFAGYFGGFPEAYLGKDFESIVLKSDKKKVKEEIAKINFSSPTVQYDHRAVTGEGSPQRWIRWIHRGIFNDKQTLIEYQAVGFDITDAHNQTADLLAKENLYTHVLEHTSDYLSVYRYNAGEFYLETFNQSAMKNLGGLPKLIGKKLSDLVDPEDKKEIESRYIKCIKDLEIVTFEENIESPGGTVSLSTTLVPIPEKEDAPARVVALSRDITKLKRTERALREEMNNAEAANRAKSEFLASMSHELRTPLNVIMGMSQLLSRSQLQTQHLKLVESIQRSSKVLLSLIEDVLDLSKIEAGKISFEMNPFNLDTLVTEVAHAFDPQASQKGLKLLRDFHLDKGVNVLGDQVRLRQVLNNLINNALKFTEKGEVKFSARLESINEESTVVYFEVKDSGIGIPKESFEKIFKRFSQADSSTSRKFGGTGLGLAISKQLVELMNGEIGFESTEGKGSTFWFKVHFQLAFKAPEQADKTDTEIDFTKLQILAVDDNPESLRFLSLFFEDNGGNLTTAESGKEALKLIERNTFDIVLMDMQMPEMDGLEATKRIRQLPSIKKRTPVIALTANAMPGDKEICLRAGMNDYLTKPVDLEELKKLLRKWI